MFETIIDRNSAEYSRRFNEKKNENSYEYKRDLSMLNCVVEELENVIKDFPSFSFEKFMNMTKYARYVDAQQNHIETVRIMGDFQRQFQHPEYYVVIAYTLTKKEGDKMGTLFVEGISIETRRDYLQQIKNDLIRFRISVKD